MLTMGEKNVRSGPGLLARWVPARWIERGGLGPSGGSEFLIRWQRDGRFCWRRVRTGWCTYKTEWSPGRIDQSSFRRSLSGENIERRIKYAAKEE